MQMSLSLQKRNTYRKSRVWGVVLVLGALLIGGCMPVTPLSDATETVKIMPQDNETSTPLVDESPAPTTPSREERPAISTPKITPDEISQPLDNPVTGEVPQDLLDMILAYLASHLEISTEEIQVLRSEAVVWPDGALGCPTPGEVYTQAPVEGYWVILQAYGVEFDYRLTDSGYFRLCPGGGGILISPPEGDPPKQ